MVWYGMAWCGLIDVGGGVLAAEAEAEDTAKRFKGNTQEGRQRRGGTANRLKGNTQAKQSAMDIRSRSGALTCFCALLL